MSWKSIRFSIYAIVLMSALLFGIVFLFGFNAVLGIIGIVIWIVVPGVMRRKALNEASGVVDRVLAKYITPVVATLLAALTITLIATGVLF